ncbi:hypothetical protein B0J17DRAFT_115998 [Rhizoctonia solani]|nr:hypothetical protein B0J17DRAFT_115998 [Rhizoctonia solani]
MIEIYTQERPYGNTDIGHDEKCAIIAGTLRPWRPWRIPLNSRGKAFWSLLQQCWAGNPETRPTSTELYEQVRAPGLQSPLMAHENIVTEHVKHDGRLGYTFWLWILGQLDVEIRDVGLVVIHS